MTPQDLKNSVLQLAIQGKLVEQRPEEGTAEELYQQIQAKKQRLIKAGTVKKEKPIPEIPEDEKPFDIPESWKWYRIGSICNIVNGFTPLRSNPDFWDGNIPWFTIDDVRDQGRFINYTSQHISRVALSNNTERIVPADTVLLCCTASVGEYAYTNISLTTNQQFNALVVRNEYKHIIEPMFIFEFVQTLKSSLISKAGKTTFNFLSVGKLAEMLIPLPPLAEQKRIVAKIEGLLPYIDRYEKAWSKLEDFNKRFPTDMQKSILQMAIQGKLVEQCPEEGTGEELYRQIQAEKQRLIKAGTIKKENPLPEITEDEKPFDIPESWKWVRLGNIAFIQSSKRVFEKDYVSKGIPFYRSKEIGDLYRGQHIQTELYITIEHYEQLKEFHGVPKSGDILITSVGSIGNTWICDSREFYYKDGNITQICSNGYFEPAFIERFIHSPLFETQALSTASGTAYSALTIIKLKNIIIPLPPLTEQKRIISKLEELLPLCEKLK